MYLAAIVDFRFAALIEDGTHWTDRPTPQNHAEAMASQYAEEWRAAEAKERRALEERDVLGDLKPIPKGRKLCDIRFVYKWKPPAGEGGGSATPRAPRAKCRAACRDFHWIGGDSVGETTPTRPLEEVSHFVCSC